MYHYLHAGGFLLLGRVLSQFQRSAPIRRAFADLNVAAMFKSGQHPEAAHVGARGRPHGLPLQPCRTSGSYVIIQVSSHAHGAQCRARSQCLICPICHKRKAKRFCPARGDSICAVCCGTEREVSIDCPWDCPYLVASRKYDEGRREIDWGSIPFSDVEISQGFVQAHLPLMMALLSSIGRYSGGHRQVVDTDVVASLKALAETYRTLSSGLYYEKPPDYLYPRELYQELKAALEEFQRVEAQRQGLTSTRNSDIRDALIYLTRLAAIRANGRPKGRAFLDLIREVAPNESAKADSRIVLLS